MNTAFVAFGSNLGDRRATLRRARALLGAGNEIEVVKNSRLYESEPVGGPAGQPSYLNAVVEVQTRFTPGQLLRRCLSIEDFFGRRREVRWGARTLDLDLLSYDAKVVDGPDLTIPHPRIQERSFVLLPLAEIAPDWRHPLLQKTAKQLCGALTGYAGIRPAQRQW